MVASRRSAWLFQRVWSSPFLTPPGLRYSSTLLGRAAGLEEIPRPAVPRKTVSNITTPDSGANRVAFELRWPSLRQHNRSLWCLTAGGPTNEGSVGHKAWGLNKGWFLGRAY